MKEYERLSQMSERELKAHQMINNMDDPFMRKITLEGTQGLADLQREDLWKSIVMKKQMFSDVNSFMNSLTDDEFNEFIQARDIPVDKLTETGRHSEVYKPNLEFEQRLELKEQVLNDEATQAMQFAE